MLQWLKLRNIFCPTQTNVAGSDCSLESHSGRTVSNAISCYQNYHKRGSETTFKLLRFYKEDFSSVLIVNLTVAAILRSDLR